MIEANIQRWKSRPIFLSSTFRDMHAERDHLRHKVVPKLAEELRKRRYHLEWIDLRQGVEAGATLEEEEELLVLKVCLEEVKRSRPYLIVLLGDRYGWVPPTDRLSAAAREAGFSGEIHNRSVTALEIEFGILKDCPNQRSRSFFYFREPLPYDVMPPEIRASYCEKFATDAESTTRWAALEELKQRLSEDKELEARIYRYSAEWDTEKNTVAGLEAWGEQVFQDLWRELDDETHVFSSAPIPTWQEVERGELAEFIEHRTRGFTGREETIAQLLALARSPSEENSAWAACVTGPLGSGKSALFAQLKNTLEGDNQILLLANAAGVTSNSSDPEMILRRWISELSASLTFEPQSQRVQDPDPLFNYLLAQAAKKKRVVILLDGVDQLEPKSDLSVPDWCRRFRLPNVRFLATSLLSKTEEALPQDAGIRFIELPLLKEWEAETVAKNVWALYHHQFNPHAYGVLAAKRNAEEERSAGNPLWLTLASEQLNLLDADDFSRAELQFHGTESERLKALLRDTAENLPGDLEGLYAWIINRNARYFGEYNIRAFSGLLSLKMVQGDGWRESELLEMIPKVGRLLYPDAKQIVFSRTILAQMRRSFRPHLRVVGEDQRLTVAHSGFSDAVNEQLFTSFSEKSLIFAVATNYLALNKQAVKRRGDSSITSFIMMVGAMAGLHDRVSIGGALEGLPSIEVWVAQRLVELEPDNLQWQRDLALTHEKEAAFCRYYQEREQTANEDSDQFEGPHSGADAQSEAYERELRAALEIWKKVSTISRDVTDYRKVIGIHKTLAKLFLSEGDLLKATTEREQAIEIARAITREQPRHTPPQRFSMPIPHPNADPQKAARLNLEYQQSLREWKALPWRKRLWTKKPEPPSGI
jgi:Domain of unknown function (DUF4062)/AAA domain